MGRPALGIIAPGMPPVLHEYDHKELKVEVGQVPKKSPPWFLEKKILLGLSTDLHSFEFVSRGDG